MLVKGLKKRLHSRGTHSWNNTDGPSFLRNTTLQSHAILCLKIVRFADHARFRMSPFLVRSKLNSIAVAHVARPDQKERKNKRRGRRGQSWVKSLMFDRMGILPPFSGGSEQRYLARSRLSSHSIWYHTYNIDINISQFNMVSIYYTIWGFDSKIYGVFTPFPLYTILYC